MIDKLTAQTEGKIYPADSRGINENSVLRQYSTFNYAGYYQEHKKAFGRLEVFNDNILAAGKEIMIEANPGTCVVIIPVTGDLLFKANEEQGFEVGAGEVYTYFLVKAGMIELANPHNNHWIHFLHLEFNVADFCSCPTAALHSFDIDAVPDQLVEAVPFMDDHTGQVMPFSVHIGRFGGRREASFTMVSPHYAFFAFVLAGAFEVEGRLLQEHDSLALWNRREAVLEALSNNAVILVIEFAFK